MCFVRCATSTSALWTAGAAHVGASAGKSLFRGGAAPQEKSFLTRNVKQADRPDSVRPLARP